MSFKSWCVAKCSLPRSLSLSRRKGRKEERKVVCRCVSVAVGCVLELLVKFYI